MHLRLLYTMKKEIVIHTSFFKKMTGFKEFLCSGELPKWRRAFGPRSGVPSKTYQIQAEIVTTWHDITVHTAN